MKSIRELLEFSVSQEESASSHLSNCLFLMKALLQGRYEFRHDCDP